MRNLLLTIALLALPGLALGQGGTPAGGYNTGAGGSSSSSPSDQTVSPLSFGAKWDVKFEGDCTFNTTTTVVCAGGNFAASDVGKIEFGTCGTTQVNPGMISAAGLIVPQGTITGFTNSTTVTVSIAATGNCTPSATIAGSFAWGTQDDTTAINNASTAAWNTNGARCVLQLPAGAAFFSAPIFNGPSNNQCMGGPNVGSLPDVTSAGPVVYGQGMAGSVLIPLPSFNFALCTQGSGTTCIGGLGNLHTHDFGINGLQQTLGGAPHSVNLFEVIGSNNGGVCDGGSTAWNLALADWGLRSSGSTGFQFGIAECADASIWNIVVSAFGLTPCHVTSNLTLNAYGLFCFGASGNVLELDGGTLAGGIFNSFGGMYLGPLLTQFAAIHCNQTGAGAGITFNSWGDEAGSTNGTPAQTSAVICNGPAAKLNFHGSTLYVPSDTTGASQVIFLNGGNVVHLDHTILNANGGANNHLFTTAATDKVFDDGGNTFTAGAVGNTFSGPLFGNFSMTGTALTVGAVVPSANWGTSAAVSAPFGATTDISFTLTNGSAAVGASPTLTYTFPTPFLVRPNYCTIQQTGGTQAQIANEWSVGTPTTTSVVFTYNATPTVNLTEFIAVSCH